MKEDEIEVLSPHDEGHRTYILVTGANSGLGFAICKRLINEFVKTRPSFQSLTLIPTTRDVKKAKETVAGLKTHLQRLDKDYTEALSNRVNIQPELVDLTSLSSVQALAAKLVDSIPQLDTIICNAGFGGTTGINWPLCLWSIAIAYKTSLTYPPFKLSGTGYVTAPQIPLPSPSSPDGNSISDSKVSSSNPSPKETSQHPPLGKVFTSNVFGHYLLIHLLTPLLTSSPDNGRIVFESSLEAYPHAFHLPDLQGLTTAQSYESSKRLTDILALTSALPSTAPFVKRFLTPPASTPTQSSAIHLADNEPSPEPSPTRISLTDNETRSSLSNTQTNPVPAIYLTHPGICATNFVPLNLFLQFCMAAAFYLARLLGSPWHTVSAWKGAKAPVWVALAQREEMEDMEVEGGRGKWGSSVNVIGREEVRRTYVQGWGIGGKVGDREGEEATREEREEFEEVGRGCWREMEGLRVAWQERLRGEV